MTVSTSSARHLLVRLGQPARLPDAILGTLRDEVVLAGWLRASGVLSDVHVRVVDPSGNNTRPPRTIAGRIQVISLEGSIGLANGDVSCGLRVVLARESESGGIETIAGDLVEARVEALEVLITAFDDLTGVRELDASGVWVLDASGGTNGAGAPHPPHAPLTSSVVAAAPPAPPPAAAAPAPAPAPAPSPAVSPAASPQPVAAHASGFGDVVRASEAEAQRPAPFAPPAPPFAPAPAAEPPPRPKPSPTFSMSAAMPQRIAKPAVAETEDDPVPEPGDVVEHFAFGRCEVVKTDGDRLHVRLGKDQRIKEIALEMLKVTVLPLEEGQTGASRHWKLARKL